MMFTSRAVGNVLVFDLSGRLDATTSEQLAARLLPEIEGETRQVLFNLAEISYMSSIGLRVLVQSAKTLKASGSGLRICAAGPSVQKVLEISGLDQLFGLRDTEDAALAAIAAN